MPAVIDPNTCDRNFAACFPAKMCPKSAFSFDSTLEQVLIDDSMCADCPGPCVNFCDQYAIRYVLEPDEFVVLKAKTLGEMSDTEAAEELSRLKEAAKEEEEARKPTIDATAATFDDVVLRSELPVIVDFWAPWCGPCKMMAPVFEELARQYGENIRFVKVDTEAEPSLGARFQITAIPTLGLFWRGRMVDSITGALPKAQLQSLAYQFLAAVRQHEAAEATAGNGGEPGTGPLIP
jgi:thioredoxin 2